MEAASKTAAYSFNSPFLEDISTNKGKLKPEEIESALHFEAAAIVKTICVNYPEQNSTIKDVVDEVINDRNRPSKHRVQGLTKLLQSTLMGVGVGDEDAIKLIINLKYLSRVAPEQLSILEPYWMPFNNEKICLGNFTTSYFRAAGGFDLRSFPYRGSWTLNDLKISFQLEPITEKITLQIAPSVTELCLCVNDVTTAYTSRENSVTLEVYPSENKSKVKVFQFIGGYWQPQYHICLLSGKLNPRPTIIPFHARTNEVNSLKLNESNKASVIEYAEAWVGHGRYIEESAGICKSGYGGWFDQDLKIITLYETDYKNM